MVTPWPDDRSGIADYAFDLAQSLVKHPITLTVFTKAANPQSVDKVRIINSPVEQWDLTCFDQIVYQLGNGSEFHGHMIDLLRKHRGVIHLHDFVLHHLIVSHADKNNLMPNYLATLERLYGPAVRQDAEVNLSTQNPLWVRDEVLQYPMCEPLLEQCSGAIIHSRFVYNQVRQRLPYLPTIIIAQTYLEAPASPVQRNNSCFRIGIFGHVHRNRCIDQVLLALQKLELSSDSVSIRIVGQTLDPEYDREIQSLLEPLRGRVSYEAIGYVTPSEFHQELANCDVCVALRNPTMGETSSVVVRCMKLGKPIIVTRTGWYSELPDCVLKIDVGLSSVPELATILNRLIIDSEYRRKIGAATLAISNSEYNVDSATLRYFNALHLFYNAMHSERAQTLDPYLIVDPLVTAFTGLGMNTPADEAGIRANMYQKIVPCLEA